MKKLFIDCGTANFTGLNYFKNLYSFTKDNTKIICFEANPITFKSYPIPTSIQHLDIEHYNLAVSDSNELVTINCCEVEYDNLTRYKKSLRLLYRIRFALARLVGKYPEFTAQGSNILDNPPLQDGDAKFKYKKLNVKSVRLSEYILNNYTKYSEINIKMDIEGSEFSVIDDLVSSKAYLYINKMYVEFHERFFEDQELYFNKKQSYINLFKQNNKELVEWV